MPVKRATPETAEHEYLWRHIPEPLWREAKSKAARDNVTMEQVLRLLLEAWVQTEAAS